MQLFTSSFIFYKINNAKYYLNFDWETIKMKEIIGKLIK